MNKPRAYTPEECREMLLKHFKTISNYWKQEHNNGHKDAFSGLVFSILASLDGDSIEIPAFDIKAHPHPDDRKYCISEGENYWKTGTDVTCGYPLHEFWHTITDE